MPNEPFNVSVTAPLVPALERAKKLLFRPFDLNTWLVLGFCAWLDQLGRWSGGGGTSFNFRNHRNESLSAILAQAREYIVNNLYWLIPVAILAAVVGLAIWLLFTWLSSRGQFLFLHNVATARNEVAAPWAGYARAADSLFVFRVVLGLIALALLVPLGIMSFWLINQLGGTPLPFIGLIGIALTAFGLGLIALVARKLTRDFVVPIMYLHTPSCLEGWRRFSTVLADHALDFLLYLLFSIVLAIGIGVLVLAVVILTCCCAGCLLAIPFVGTVLLLPVHVFVRAYSAEYLAQFGPGFNVFTPVPSS